MKSLESVYGRSNRGDGRWCFNWDEIFQTTRPGWGKKPREALNSKPPSHALELGLAEYLLPGVMLPGVLETFEGIRNGMLFGQPAGPDVYQGADESGR